MIAPIGSYDAVLWRQYAERLNKQPRPPYVQPKTHRITVNCATGARTVESEIVVPPAPPPHPAVVRRPVPPPAIYRPMHLTAAQQIAAGRTVFHRILGAVEAAWDIPPGRLIGTRQTKALYQARYASYKLVRLLLRWSSPTMAEAYGRKDHTAVLAGIKRADSLHETDAEWRERYDVAHAALTLMEAAESTL